MTTVDLWWTLLHLRLGCTDYIKYPHQHSKCCKYRSRHKLIHFTLNESRNWQCGCLVALIIFLMQDEKPFTLHSHSSLACSRERVSVDFDYNGSEYNKHRQRCIKVMIFHLIIGYPNTTRSRTTWNWGPEIGANGSSERQQNPWLEGCRYGIGPRRSRRSGFWTVLIPNRTFYLIHNLTAHGFPGPVANTSCCDI